MTDSPNDATQSRAARSRSGRAAGLIIRSLLPIGLLAGGFYAFATLSQEPEEEKSPPEEEKVLRTRVEELHVTDYPVVIKTQGVVRAHNEVSLSARVSGQIKHISPSFEVGAYFSKGDVLVQLDSSDYETAVAIAQAQLDIAESSLEIAEKDYVSFKKLLDREFISQAEFDRYIATQTQAQASLESATARLEQAKLELERTTIRAPFDGRVRRKLVGVGQSIGPGTTLGDVFAVDFAEVRLPISARERAYLDLPEFDGDAPVPVEFRDAISAEPETVWEGKIVRTEGALDEDSLELFAIARIDDPFGLESGRPPMRIGQPVEAAMRGHTLENVVALPRGAVRELNRISLVDKSDMTLTSMTIEPIWSDEKHVIVPNSAIGDGLWLATTHLVYAPEGSKVELIPNSEELSGQAQIDRSDS